MWRDKRLMDRLGIRHPIVQAPMAGAATPAMAAAAANAGALGGLGVALMTPEAAVAACKEAQGATNGAISINFFCHEPPRRDAAREQASIDRLAPYYAEFGLGAPAAPTAGPGFGEAQLEAALAAAPPVVSFHFGLPAPALLAPLKAAGIFIMSSATSPKEAEALEAAGADAIIAQGWEAGGHRGAFNPDESWGEMGTMALVPAIVDRVAVPVIAAGGIGDGRGVAAALMLGAAGVQIGTAFLTSPEASVRAPHKAALLNSDGADTVVTTAFSGRPARGIRNRYIEETADMVWADFPLMNPLTRPLRNACADADSADFLSLWAGQAVGLNRRTEGTGAIVSRIAAEAQALLNGG